ncbi:MAG: PQQ-binding-like beta-propeller repeat protein, partial [Planctomycetota bacterium]
MKINMEDQMASACLANLRVPLALKACLAFLLLQGCQGLSLAQENWNQFRGPRGDGIAAESALPVTFDEFRNVRWKTSVPGDGWSSPVIWEDEIWLTSGSDKSKELRVVCVSLTSGKIKHNVKVFDMLDRKINKRYKADSPHLNSPATPTPVVEEKRVFLSFGSQGLACIDRKNCQMLWQRRDLRIYQPVRQGSSPIVDDSNLYVAFDGNFEQYFVALDKFTGQTVWKRDRNIGSDWADTLRERGLNIDEVERVKPGDNRKAFATATLINVQGHEQLIAPAAEATIAYDPKTGDELWRVTHPGGFNVSARPIYSNGLVYVFTSGLNSRLLAIRPDGRGDVTDTHVAWSTSKGTPEIPSPIIVDGALFMVTAKGGVARCLDASTGHERWKKRLGGDHWASPIFAQGLLYFSNKQGVVSIVDVREDTPNLIASNKLDASFIASAAVAGSSLILRSKTHLYCVEEG